MSKLEGCPDWHWNEETWICIGSRAHWHCFMFCGTESQPKSCDKNEKGTRWKRSVQRQRFSWRTIWIFERKWKEDRRERLDSDGSGCGPNKAIKQERRREVGRSRNETRTHRQECSLRSRSAWKQFRTRKAACRRLSLFFEKGVLNISGGAHIFAMYFWRPEKWHDRNNELVEAVFFVNGERGAILSLDVTQTCTQIHWWKGVCADNSKERWCEVFHGWMSKTSSIIWSTKRHRRIRRSQLWWIPCRCQARSNGITRLEEGDNNHFAVHSRAASWKKRWSNFQKEVRLGGSWKKQRRWRRQWANTAKVGQQVEVDSKKAKGQDPAKGANFDPLRKRAERRKRWQSLGQPRQDFVWQGVGTLQLWNHLSVQWALWGVAGNCSKRLSWKRWKAWATRQARIIQMAVVVRRSNQLWSLRYLASLDACAESRNQRKPWPSIATGTRG